jgi:glycosyltransferase involved in cell wall biosynthesis
MKVANFTDTYAPNNNGIATSLYELHHTGKKWEDVVFCPIKHGDVIQVSGVPFPLFPEYKLALNAGSLAERIKDGDFHLIHNHTPYAMFYYGHKIARDLGLPLVGTFHTDPAAVFGALMPTGSKLGKPATGLTWGYLTSLYNKCDLVIATSGWLEKELQRREITRPIQVVPNGVNTGNFNPKVDCRGFLDRYKITEGKRIVLSLGRLQYKKDPETFVRAALESKSDAIFIVAGKGGLEGRLKALAKNDDRVVFTGYLPDELVPQAFAAADVFVLSSEMETQAVVLLQALASGTPCISTRVGMAEELLDDQYIFPHGDYKALAKRIDELLGNEGLRKRLAREGRKKAEGYSVEEVADRLYSVYKNI